MSKRRTINIGTPWRKKSIKRLARKNYRAAATSLVHSPLTNQRLLHQFIRVIRAEMKCASSAKHASSLLQNTADVSNLIGFSWEKIAEELESILPTLTSLLKGILPKATESIKPLLSMITCMLLKRSNSRLSFAQKAMSVLLYGNASSKQVRI